MPLVGQGIGINVSRQATDRANGSCALVSTAPSCDCAKMAKARYNVITIEGARAIGFRFKRRLSWTPTRRDRPAELAQRFY